MSMHFHSTTKPQPRTMAERLQLHGRERCQLRGSAAMLATAVLLAACSGPQHDYARALPADAMAIACLPADVSDSTMHRLTRAAESAGMPAMLPREACAMAAHSTAGEPLYLFVTPDMHTGLLMPTGGQAVIDEAIGQAAAQGRATAPDRQHGLTWAQIGTQTAMAYDDSRALLLTPASTADDATRRLMHQLLTQDASQSVMATPLWQHLSQAADGAPHSQAGAAFAVAAGRLPAMLRTPLTRLLATDRMQQTYLAGTIDMPATPAGHSRTDIDLSVVTADEAAAQRLALMASVLRPISGEALAWTDSRTTAAIVAAASGKQLLQALRQDDTVRQALIMANLIVDADQMLAAIDGDVLIETACPTDSHAPMRLTARLESDSPLREADYWLRSTAMLSSLRLTTADSRNFCLRLPGQPDICFGIPDATRPALYVTNSPTLTPPAATPPAQPSPLATLMAADTARLAASDIYAAWVTPAATLTISMRLRQQ